MRTRKPYDIAAERNAISRVLERHDKAHECKSIDSYGCDIRAAIVRAFCVVLDARDSAATICVMFDGIRHAVNDTYPCKCGAVATCEYLERCDECENDRREGMAHP